jgi:hypothetical protein
MKNSSIRRFDKILAVVFGILSIVFIILAFANERFFQWAFERHQNQMSWYIRPLFLIPFCYFALKRSWGGIFGTVFFLLTSMFWFPKPETAGEQVKSFLEMEQAYLTGNWGVAKILITLLVPLSLGALALAFWKRSLWLGVSVLIFIAVAKMLWSVVFGGASGTAVIAPAILGLADCIALICIGFVRLEKRKRPKE